MSFTAWPRVVLRLDNGEEAEAIAPVIVSASRATDIPALYGAWFVERYKRGYVTWVNPFSGTAAHVSFVRTRAVVFWTKNAAPFLRHLAELDSLQPNYLFQFTVNDYEREGLEPGLPPLGDRVAVFREIAGRLGPERVVWRFDPLALGGSLTVAELSDRIARLGEQLTGATRRLVVSFVDIARYAFVRRRLARTGINLREFTEEEMQAIGRTLAVIGRCCGMEVSTCAEEVDLREYGIAHSRCIDDQLLRMLFPHDRELMEFLGPLPDAQAALFEADAVRRHPLKDRGQRALCGCIASKDIGRYDTCCHGCLYCYANSSAEAVARNRAAMGYGFPAVLGASPNS